MTPAEKLMRWLPPGLERAYGQYNPVSKEHHFINRPLTLQQYEDHITGIRSLGVVPIDENGEVSWAASKRLAPQETLESAFGPTLFSLTTIGIASVVQNRLSPKFHVALFLAGLYDPGD